MIEGSLVRILEEKADEYYYVGAASDLGVGIALGEFTTPTGELFYDISWATGDREWVRPSWLILIKKSSGKSPSTDV